MLMQVVGFTNVETNGVKHVQKAHSVVVLTSQQQRRSSSSNRKRIFPQPPLVAYRRNRNLDDLLVSRRLPSDTQISVSNTTSVDRNSCVCEECNRTFTTARGKMIHYKLMHQKTDINADAGNGFHKCGDKRCMTCAKGTFGKSINITATKKKFEMTQKITCKTSNVVYCITCTKCRKQYIGETKQEIHQRQTGHLSDIKKKITGLPYVRHFLECGVEHYTITGVEKVRSRDPLIRKSRETFYKNLFKVQIV